MKIKCYITLFSLCIRPSGIMVKNHYWHVLPPVIATIEMSSYLLVRLSSNGGPVVVNLLFSYVLFMVYFTADTMMQSLVLDM
jgi:hypothetical protein